MTEHNPTYERDETSQYGDAPDLITVAREWARALDVIHTKTFIGPGPHPELEAFQALEKGLRDLALRGIRD